MATTDQIGTMTPEELAESVENLTEQVTVLREAVDDLREEFTWAVRNNRTVVWPTVPVLKRLDRNGEVNGEGERVGSQIDSRDSPLARLLRGMIEDVQIAIAEIATEQLDYFLSELDQTEKRLLNELIPKLRQETLAFASPDDDAASVAEDIADQPELPIAVGATVSFSLDGIDQTGEVLAVDIDAWTAEVCVPSQVEPVTVSLDQFGLLPPEEKVESIPAEPPNDLVLFEAGDEVEFAEDGKTVFAEVISVDDARNEAIVEVITTGEQKTVCQDDLTKTEPDEQLDQSPADLSVVISPEKQRLESHQQWCREVRDAADTSTEGRRSIASSNGQARLEYELAPLPNGAWAVRWSAQYDCGTLRRCSSPWNEVESRDTGLQRVLQEARMFFSNEQIEPVQQPLRREMLSLLGDGLFGFIEPEPVKEPASNQDDVTSTV